MTGEGLSHFFKHIDLLKTSPYVSFLFLDTPELPSILELGAGHSPHLELSGSSEKHPLCKYKGVSVQPQIHKMNVPELSVLLLLWHRAIHQAQGLLSCGAWLVS